MTIVSLYNSIRCFKYNFSKLKIAQIMIAHKYIFNKFLKSITNVVGKSDAYHILKLKGIYIETKYISFTIF